MKNQLTAIEKELEQLPSGYLVKKRKFLYHKIGKKEVGITNDKELIRQLARKKFLLEQRKDITKTPKEIINILPNSYKDLPLSFFYHTKFHQWIDRPEIKNSYPLTTTYYSKNGTVLRSKSELIIANSLEEYEIPYRYDNLLQLNGQKMYPDFIIKNPFTNKTIIWEHFGALNQPDYEQRMSNKMKTYLEQGLIPFDNLIYTFEFDLGRINDIIEKIIL